MQNLIIAVGLRAKGGFFELTEKIKSLKMLNLTYTEDNNVVNFYKLLSFLKANQRYEQPTERSLSIPKSIFSKMEPK